MYCSTTKTFSHIEISQIQEKWEHGIQDMEIKKLRTKNRIKQSLKWNRDGLQEEKESKSFCWKRAETVKCCYGVSPPLCCLFPCAVASFCHRVVPTPLSWSEAGPAPCPINTHKSFTCCTHQRQLFLISAEICCWSELPILHLRA